MDLVWVALSPFLAIAIRENFQPSGEKLEGLIPYALMCVLSAAFVFVVGRLHRKHWRYVSLGDILRLIAGVTVALLMAVVGTFTIDRLEGVARSLPVIQWLLLIALMTASRIATRLLGERHGRKARLRRDARMEPEHVLLVGMNSLTELYVRSAAEIAPHLHIEGILAAKPKMHGQSIRGCEILGAPEDVRKIVSQLEVHGIIVRRVVVTQAFDKLSKETRDALDYIERSSDIKVEYLIESLGFCTLPETQSRSGVISNGGNEPIAVPVKDEELHKGYRTVKRLIDIVGSITLIIVLAPLLALIALLVAMDVGFPLVFWQQRPGRHGLPFKLFKFRTMGAAHDINGNRISDEMRSSGIGRFLRTTWLDETPQLYNILLGEMSFVGPRPLLPMDQPEGYAARLVVRPGLTGWAQINGGRDISVGNKESLDIWYIKNASLWLDIKILVRTAMMLMFGDRKQEADQVAHNEAKQEARGQALRDDQVQRDQHAASGV